MAKKMEAGQTQTLKKVLHYMKPYRFFLLLSVILAAITVASTLYLPLLIGKAVDCICLLYTSPSPRDGLLSRIPSSA